jgi:hypothetical protein
MRAACGQRGCPPLPLPPLRSTFVGSVRRQRRAPYYGASSFSPVLIPDTPTAAPSITRTAPRPAASDLRTASSDEGFQQPIIGGGETNLADPRSESIADQQYAYDTAGHRWLQGVVSYDPRDKSWGIVYSIDPQPNDPHAGYLTLVNDPRLAALKDGDVVRLDGQIDPTRLDFSNRPSYAVQQITPISR